MDQPSSPGDEQIVATASRNRCLVFSVCALLVLAVGLVFGQTVRLGFVNYDDNAYVYENAQVARGLSVQGIVWAFTHSHAMNWHPLTWISLMADCQLYGLNAGGHHITNVILHAATAVLLFLVLRRMTGRFWPSALVAAIFAVHPLRVESVAWVTERKDVLSGLFFMLTLAAYVHYVRKPFSLGRYLPVVALFALGLMAKPMLVTLPFVLLLLDYWPLRRMTPLCRRVITEKLPLLLLTAISCVVTVWAQGGAVVSIESLPVWRRISNALVSYVAYIGQLLCPLGLAAFYPHPGATLPLWKVIAAAVVLVCIFAAVLAHWRRRPYLVVGWLWYLGMLAPVIGLAQTGPQAMADRYTYVAQIGLYVALIWGAAQVVASWPYRRWVGCVASALVLAVLMGCAWRQTCFWRDSETLWTHTLACTSRNNVAHCDLGSALLDLGRVEEALTQYRKALEIRPDDAMAHHNLGAALSRLGRFDEATAHYRKALEIQPDSVEVHCDLGTALVRLGRFDEALTHYRQALEIRPSYAMGHNNLGNFWASRGRLDEALAQYRQALEIDADCVMARCNLANLLAGAGRLDEAVAQYRQILESQPDYAAAHTGLGAALAGLGQFDESLAHYRKVLELKPNNVTAYHDLGAFLADRGQFEEALAYYQQALKIQPADAVAHCKLAWLRATCPRASLRNGAEAVEHALQANRLCKGTQPEVLDALAAAYAETGWFPEALATARRAVELATRQKNPAFADALRTRIALYEAGRPFHQMQPPTASPP
jgi:tetratricopeptide (TPR) repeat protein